MIKRLALVAGLGAGYVLGAKAGTERYEQIMQGAQDLVAKLKARESLLDDTPMATHGNIDLSDTTQTVNTQV